jgi:hypothetical protein
MTAERIIEQFRDVADVELVVHVPEQGNPLLGRVATVGPPQSGAEREAIEQKYGAFSIGVFRDFSPQLRDLLIHGSEADAGGIYWEQQFPEDQREEPYWSAMKFYGNAQLLWWSSERRVDARWRALDGILGALDEDG